MEVVMRAFFVVLALLTGIFPAGSCVRVALNPHGGCCAVDAPPKRTCCEKHRNEDKNTPCSPLSEKMPCCAYMPGDLACAESIPFVLPALYQSMGPSAPLLIHLAEAKTELHSCSVPLGALSTWPLFISHHCILV
jgi:hypothetical protein